MQLRCWRACLLCTKSGLLKTGRGGLLPSHLLGVGRQRSTRSKVSSATVISGFCWTARALTQSQAKPTPQNQNTNQSVKNVEYSLCPIVF